MWGQNKKPDSPASIQPLVRDRPQPTSIAVGPGPLPGSSGRAVASALTPSRSARLGATVNFEGEIISGEDLFIDGKVTGSINVPEHTVAIGRSSKVEAEIHCRELILHGKLKGKAFVSKRIFIKKTGAFDGSLVTHRVAIEDGGVFRGSCDIKIPEKQAAAKEPKAPARPARASEAAPPPRTHPTGVPALRS